MPTLRRSKSLNDKVTRQKNRSSDVVRDPRSPDVGGRTRTRTCLDNYQLLVHLKKQTDDKSRQLELAYTYGGHAQPFLRSGASQRASVHRPLSEFHPLPSTHSESASGGSDFQPGQPGPPKLAAGSHYRQHSAEGCSGQDPRRVVKRQESFPEDQLVRSCQQQGQKCQRPVSMFEARACSPLPRREVWVRQNQILQVQTPPENQNEVHNPNSQNEVHNPNSQQLRFRIEELELENARLKDILDAHSIPHVTLPRASKLRSHKGAPLAGHDLTHRPTSEAFPRLSSTLISPVSDTSVSGYGSLAGSAYDEGYTATLEAGGHRGRKVEDMGATAEVGGYNDDTLPLSEVSGERVGSEDSTLPSSLSSGANSRVPTLSRESGKEDLQSIHEKLDQVLELERHRGGDGQRRVADLEQQVQELSEQRNTVLERYKLMLEEHGKLQTREERVQEELRALLQQHGQTLQHVLRHELQQLQQELQGLGQDVRRQLDLVLTSLASSSSSWLGLDGRDGRGVSMDPDVRAVVNKVVDLIGPEYLRLGRRLHVPPLELERIEEGGEDFAHKTRRVLHTWLSRHQEKREEEGDCPGVSAPPPAHLLIQALRDIDKDIRLFNHEPISSPERQALRRCLQVAIDHVTGVSDLLDHLIMLNALSPAGVTFVQEVLAESRERALCRLWHVTEYRGSGVLSRLALALERSGHPHVSRSLTDELEIQNSRLHSRPHFHPLGEDMDSPIATQAAQSLGSRPSPCPAGRSGPNKSRPDPDPIFEAVGLPVRPLKKSEKTTALSRQGDGGGIVWDRRVPPGGRASREASSRPVLLEQGTTV